MAFTCSVDPKNLKTCQTLSEWDLRKGAEALDYLKARTKENPFFAVVTGALHSGPIDYERQQEYVEKAANMSPAELMDIITSQDRIKGAQFWEKKGKLLAHTATCYSYICGEDGGKCKKSNKKMEEMITCLAEAPGIGLKTHDLIREYFGDDEAVAVDRHIKRFLTEDNKLYKIKHKKLKDKASIHPEDYAGMKKAFQKAAKDCCMKPAELQVAAWVRGACRSRNDTVLNLGEGNVIYCSQRDTKPLTEFT